MDYRKMTAPCGLDCFNCPLYIAKDDMVLRKKISENKGLSFDKAFCEGCRNHNGTIPFLDMKEPCSVYKCITQKQIEFCSDCSDFPCDNLHPYAEQANEKPHNTKVFNLALIKKMGLENWAKEKAKQVKQTYFKGKFKL